MKIHEPLVVVEVAGALWSQDGKLMVGTEDVGKKFLDRWGGFRQYGKLRVTWEPITFESTEMAPSGDQK